MKRHNYYLIRYGQYVLAGKIALANEFPIRDESGKLFPVYNRDGQIDLSVVGQDYLRSMHIDVINFEI